MKEREEKVLNVLDSECKVDFIVNKSENGLEFGITPGLNLPEGEELVEGGRIVIKKFKDDSISKVLNEDYDTFYIIDTFKDEYQYDAIILHQFIKAVVPQEVCDKAFIAEYFDSNTPASKDYNPVADVNWVMDVSKEFVGVLNTKLPHGFSNSNLKFYKINI